MCHDIDRELAHRGYTLILTMIYIPYFYLQDIVENNKRILSILYIHIYICIAATLKRKKERMQPGEIIIMHYYYALIFIISHSLSLFVSLSIGNQNV